METFVLLSLLAVTGAAAPPGRVLTLDEALRTAIAHQPQLRQARANTEVASARADESRAALLPQVSGNASYERTTSNFVLRPSSLPTSVATMKTPGPTFDTFNFWSFGLQLNQLVWDFQSVDRWKSSKATAVAQRDVEKTTTLQVETQVRTTYFTARAQKALVVVAQETLANQQKHMVQISGFVRVGTRPEIDLATAKTNVANAEVQLINAENAYETAKAQLNLAIGVAGPTDYDVADETLPPVDGEDLTTDALYDEALKARPEVATLTEQVRAQELQLRAQQGALYAPSIGVSSALTDTGSDITNLAWNWNAQATLSWQLFTGLLNYSQVKEQHGLVGALEAQLDAQKQQVRLDVDQARLAVRAAKVSIAATEEALTNARQQLQLAEGRYQAGVGNSIELSDAQVALTQAEAQRVQSDYNLATARAQLLKALGRR